MCRAFKRYRLNGSNRCEAVETNKAFALKWKAELSFIPKEHCRMYDFDDGAAKWIVEIPIWLIEKNEQLSEILELIQEENESRNR